MKKYVFLFVAWLVKVTGWRPGREQVAAWVHADGFSIVEIKTLGGTMYLLDDKGVWWCLKTVNPPYYDTVSEYPAIGDVLSQKQLKKRGRG